MLVVKYSFYIDSTSVYNIDMPHMYPDSLPKPLDEYLKGEAKVFEKLKNQLSSDWNVYHGVNWHLQPDRFKKQRDAEADFVLTHPVYGIVVLEVKGGIQIRFDAQYNTWYSTDFNLEVHEIHDPYFQARTNKYNLIDEILKIPEMRSFDKQDLENKLSIGYAVVFSDVTMVNGELPVFAVPEITITENQLNSIEKTLIGVCQHYTIGKNIDKTLTVSMHDRIMHLLAPSFTLSRSLPAWFDDEAKQIYEMTNDQYKVLDGLQRAKRASIYGCAGSGKTLLAVRKAQLLAEQGQLVLLVCFNNILGQHLRQQFQEAPNVSAGNFHLIMSVLLGTEPIYDDQVIYDEVLEANLGYYDALIIDEAQDFSKLQLETLKLLHKEAGLLYYFWDDNQQVMKRDINVAFDLDCAQYTLPNNLRNTRRIFETVKAHYHKDIPIYHEGAIGKPVEILEAYAHRNATVLFVRLREVLKRLIEEDKLDPKDITILTFKSKQKSALRDFTSTYPQFRFSDEARVDGIRIDTVRRFKGMESKVVIVTEMDDGSSMKDPVLFDDMCYVSFSRAVHLLIILPPDSIEFS
jgi:hypothetical protein